MVILTFISIALAVSCRTKNAFIARKMEQASVVVACHLNAAGEDRWNTAYNHVARRTSAKADVVVTSMWAEAATEASKIAQDSDARDVRNVIPDTRK